MPNSVWDRIAKKYDTLWVQTYSLAPTRANVVALMTKLAADTTFRVLDLGCGTGQLIEILKSQYPISDFTGIDKSQAMIDLAQAKNPACTFYTADVAHWTLKGDPFDFIICCHSFPYYTDKRTVAARIKKMIKPGGYAIFIQASVNTLYDRIAMWFVEQTAEPAQYLSREAFERYFSEDLALIETFTIKEKWYMPSICGFVFWRK